MDNENEFFGQEESRPTGPAPSDPRVFSQETVVYGEDAPSGGLRNILLAVASGALIAGALFALLRNGSKPKADDGRIAPVLPIKIDIREPTLEDKILEVSPENAKVEPSPAEPAAIEAGEGPKIDAPKPAPVKPVVKGRVAPSAPAARRPGFVERPTDIKGEVEIIAAAGPSAAKPSASASGWSVQVLSGSSEEKTLNDWKALVSRHPALLKSQSYSVQKAVVGGRTFYRLRATGFGSSKSAGDFCAKLKSYNISCFVTK
jgi:hypothetical protein